jgi:hypothetical protein
MAKQLGQIAYEVHWSYWLNSPKWEDITKYDQERWNLSSKAVLDEHHRLVNAYQGCSECKVEDNG